MSVSDVSRLEEIPYDCQLLVARAVYSRGHVLCSIHRIRCHNLLQCSIISLTGNDILHSSNIPYHSWCHFGIFLYEIQLFLVNLDMARANVTINKTGILMRLMAGIIILIKLTGYRVIACANNTLATPSSK